MLLSRALEKPKYEIVWQPNPGPQSWLISCPVFETLFGGARGGGKSDGVLGEWACHADQYGEDAIGLCVRRERTQLRELVERSKRLYKPLGAHFNEVDKMWRFPNGARLTFAYLENDKDAESYQGHSYTRVYIEEMGTFPDKKPILKLMATLRSGANVPCRFIATANPGGPGHLWIKQRYIDPAPLGNTILWSEFENPFTGEKVQKDRVFIPSKVTDNKYTNTPEYIGNLYLAGNEDDQLLEAWLLGNWDVILGAYFHEWNTRKHVIRQFKIPTTWTRFMSMDWGSAKPFSIGWYAIVPDDLYFGFDAIPSDLFGNKLFLPKGALIKYREWYGAPKDKEGRTVPNEGLKLTVEEVAHGINIREAKEPKNDRGRPNINYRVGDPKMSHEDGGPSMFERMASRPYYINMRKADNKRTGAHGAIGGWDVLRSRLKGVDGVPMIYFFDCCTDTIRTLPALQRSETKPEDADSEGEDHAADETRYACMSRPFSRPIGNDALRHLLKHNNNTISGIVIDDNLEEVYEKTTFNKERIN